VCHVSETQWFDARVCIWYAVLLLALLRFLLSRARMEPGTRIAIAAAVISYAVWVAGLRVYRFLLPLEMLCPLLIVLLLRYIYPQARSVRVGLAAVLLAAAALTIHVPLYGRRDVRDGWVPVGAVENLGTSPVGKDAMVIMAGNAVFSHMLPSVAGDGVPVFRLGGSYSEILRPLGEGRYVPRIAAHRGPFFWFAPHMDPAPREKLFLSFGLVPDGECRAVKDALLDMEHPLRWDMKSSIWYWPQNRPVDYDLCPLKRKN
jgi:hypothetical protein